VTGKLDAPSGLCSVICENTAAPILSAPLKRRAAARLLNLRYLIDSIHCDGLTLFHVADVFVVLLLTGSPLALKFNVKKLVGATAV
jgi:hypothetical protein